MYKIMATKTIICAGCKKEKELLGSAKEYKWQLDKEFYCSYSCYSKAFDSKYQASKITATTRLSYSRGRMVDRGYERHGSR